MQPLTFEQLNALPTTTDLITAARALRIGRTKPGSVDERCW